MKYHQWTKEEIKIMLQLWETKTIQEVAEEIGVRTSQIMYMRSLLKKEGYTMPLLKRVRSHTRDMIKSVLSELKLNKK